MKNNHCGALCFVRRGSIWIFAAALFTCTTTSFVVYGDGWTRGRQVGTSVTNKESSETFTLDVWGGDGKHVHGLCSYHNFSARPFEIDGQETRGGDFYPDVIYEVSNGDDRWQTLEVPSVEFGKQLTTVVESRGTSRPLRVDLDSFTPLIGKFKYGRLVLKSGESAVFQIDELQPAEKNKNTK
jgi:hypothetical protein